MNAEFDQFANEYNRLHTRSIAFSGCEPGYFAAYKIDFAAAFFHRFCPADDSVLDFGCGTGASVPHFKRHLSHADLICADVSQKSLSILRERYPHQTSCMHIKEDRLNLSSNSIGMVFSACVFHHIEPSRHLAWLTELHRVTRSGGVLMLFEHNPANPLTRYAVSRCAFDKGAVLLSPSRVRTMLRQAGWTALKTHYHVFFPNFLRALRPLEAGLGWLPLGGQYSVSAVKR